MITYKFIISSTGKVSDDWIRDLWFNPCLHQKLIGVLVLRADIIGWWIYN